VSFQEVVHSLLSGNSEVARKACEFGLEGLVSKPRDRPYRGGRSKHWVKVKNRKHAAMSRVMPFAAVAFPENGAHGVLGSIPSALTKLNQGFTAKT
jgi:hypothetical protein